MVWTGSLDFDLYRVLLPVVSHPSRNSRVTIYIHVAQVLVIPHIVAGLWSLGIPTLRKWKATFTNTTLSAYYIPRHLAPSTPYSHVC